MGWLARILHSFRKRRDCSAEPAVVSPESPPSADEPVTEDLPLEPNHEATSVSPGVLVPVRSQGPRIIIGLDFGTSSTKVVYRRHGEEQANVLVLDQEVPGYPWFTSPSLVRESDAGSLHFGSQSLRTDSGVLHRSLKVRLLAPSSNADSKSCDSSRDPDVSLLVASYVSWLLGEVRGQLENRFGVEGFRPILNVAAPMNHLEDQGLKKRYLHIIASAWASVFGEHAEPVAQGESLDTVRVRLGPLLSTPVPDLSTRSFEVLPETVAPIASLRASTNLEPGVYTVIDMGAGTSEISVIQVSPPEFGQDRILCYEDVSFLLGADDFEAVERAVNPPTGRDAQLGALLDNFQHEHVKTWELGRRKDAKGQRHWRRKWSAHTVILTGGGARRDDVFKCIDERDNSPWAQVFAGETDYRYSVRWHSPSRQALTIPTTGSPAKLGNRSDFHLLAVAHGLSFHRREWPTWFPPAEIETLENMDTEQTPTVDWNVVE